MRPLVLLAVSLTCTAPRGDHVVEQPRDDRFRRLSEIEHELHRLRGDPHQVGRIHELRTERDALKQELADVTGPSTEDRIAALRRERRALRQQLSLPLPNTGFGRSTTGGGSRSAGPGAVRAFPYGKPNRDIHNDSSDGYRSRNDAMQRLSWVEEQLRNLTDEHAGEH